MKIRFWGTRGSLPVAMTAVQVRAKIAHALVAADGRRFGGEAEALEWLTNALPFAASGSFGGHSSCVQLLLPGEEFFICDAGSGLRPFGAHAMAARAGKPAVYHLFMSHLHWDHIMGFPFFTPAYIPGNVINIYGGHAELEHAFRRQQDVPSFPVDFGLLRADIRFHVLQPGTDYDIAGLKVRCKLQTHAGDSYGWRFEHEGRAAVYSTDSEHKLEKVDVTLGFVEFFRNAKVVVFDAMYSLADAISVKEDWGHSSNVVGVELAQMAGVEHLVLFHHEPVFDDQRIATIEAETRRFEEITRGEGALLKISAAWDGLEIDV
ncbi:MAG: MBL fold metallo-hydrolase [Rhodocyclaceae bacterium]|nr:MBL fold metallo-hydrolase [Rhodocyclaceae bacterium]MBX3667524.1 MBL fold metallo-hydrolase [Rhodocyclaceae bacterium]